MPTIIGKDHPIQIRSNGTVEGSCVRFRGTDGEWHTLDGVVAFSVGVDMRNDEEIVLARLTICNPEIEIETGSVTVEKAKV